MFEFQDLSKTYGKLNLPTSADFTKAFALHPHKRGIDCITIPKMDFFVCAPNQPATPILLVLAVFGFLFAGKDGVKEFPMQG